ncbi:MAG: cell cycle transcriptional regulator TrcR [Hyphomicrobiales bacterium]|nr:cell cycle transcriptional regulator TrcR [Hyphomicrobiales bacterium]
MDRPLMPQATAVWLVENSSLTFDQIADFCGLHPLQVKAIADGDVAQGIRGSDPITSGQLTRDEIARAQENPNHRLRLARSKVALPEMRSKRAPKYTPVSKRHERPNAILWLLRNHPELKDTQIMRLVGTTKPTIQSIRDRSHWNSSTLVPQDPVALGLCSQIDLDQAVAKASRRGKAGGEGAGEELADASPSLRPIDDMGDAAGEDER